MLGVVHEFLFTTTPRGYTRSFGFAARAVLRLPRAAGSYGFEVHGGRES